MNFYKFYQKTVVKLLRVECRKQVTSTGFWILLILHVFVILIISINISSFLKNANIMINDLPEVDLSLQPILQFPDVWQNITYIAGYFKIILAIIIISSVSNEFVNATLRQNIIDGFSRKEWLYSKIGLAKMLSLVSTLWVVLVVLFVGFTQGVPAELSSVFSRLDFVLAYFIELLVYFIYALFLVLALKRTGISIILLIVYDFIIEPILSWSLPNSINQFLPMNAIDNLNQFPFTKYVGNEIQTYVSIEQLVWAIAYGITFSVFSYVIIKKRDL